MNGGLKIGWTSFSFDRVGMVGMMSVSLGTVNVLLRPFIAFARFVEAVELHSQFVSLGQVFDLLRAL